MLTCKQIFLLSIQSNYRQFSWRKRVGMRIHLMFCSSCVRYKPQIAFIRNAARRFSKEQVGADKQTRLFAEAVGRIARELDRFE